MANLVTIKRLKLTNKCSTHLTEKSGPILIPRPTAAEKCVVLLATTAGGPHVLYNSRALLRSMV